MTSPTRLDSAALLRNYLGLQRGRVLLMALLVLLNIGLQLLNPQIIRAFIDATQSAAAQHVLLTTAALFFALVVLQRILGFVAVYVGQQIGWQATNRLRADLTRHLLSLDMGFHKRHTPGELIERVDNDIGLLSNFFAQFSLQLAGNLLLMLGILVLLYREDWRLGLALTSYTLLVAVVLWALQSFASARFAASYQAKARLYGFLEERIGGAEDIRASGAEAHTLKGLEKLGDESMRRELQAHMTGNISFALTNMLYVLGYVLGLAAGAYFYLRGEASIGTAFLIVFYIGRLEEPIEAIRTQIEDLQQAGAGLRRVIELFGIQSRVQQASHTRQLPDGALALQFEHVSFRYNDELVSLETDSSEEQQTGQPAVLQDISFTLGAGQVLGLLGRTGSGKTTLTRMLLRLYDPDAGSIRLSGVDLRDTAFAQIRGSVAMVTQDVQLFQASLRENLTLFNPRIDDQQILRALDELELRTWLEHLPHGLDTRLGAGGLGLSAGEAQLLAFARVFLRDPGLVILDEASSRLDPVTERLLERAVDRLLAGRTGVIIAHRLHTVQRADNILILDNGRIAEYGERTTLADNPTTRFAQLLNVGLEEALV